jgi:hypothetical protein
MVAIGKRSINRWMSYGLSFIFGLVVSFLLIGNRSVLAQSIPSAVTTCIPIEQVVRTELIGKTEIEGKSYYLLAAYGQGDNGAIDLVISVAGGQCQKVLFNPTGDRLSLKSAIPQAAARQLTLQRYRQILNQQGLAKMQQQVNGWAKTAGIAGYDEEVWALRQLKIAVPNHVKVN